MSTNDDAQAYRLAQAEEMLIRFEKVHGRPARDTAELEAWVDAEVAAGRIETPIQPSDEVVARRRRLN